MWPSALVWKYFGYRELAPTFDDVRRPVLKLRRPGLDLLQQRAWILPRVRNRHWDAVLIDFTSKQVIFVDSTGGSNTSVVSHACAILESVSHVLDDKPFDFSGWACGSLGLHSPKQPDGHNCGVFVLLLARCLHHDGKLTRRWNTLQCNAQRDLIALELMSAKLLTFVGELKGAGLSDVCPGSFRFEFLPLSFCYN